MCLGGWTPVVAFAPLGGCAFRLHAANRATRHNPLKLFFTIGEVLMVNTGPCILSRSALPLMDFWLVQVRGLAVGVDRRWWRWFLVRAFTRFPAKSLMAADERRSTRITHSLIIYLSCLGSGYAAKPLTLLGIGGIYRLCDSRVMAADKRR